MAQISQNCIVKAENQLEMNRRATVRNRVRQIVIIGQFWGSQESQIQDNQKVSFEQLNF